VKAALKAARELGFPLVVKPVCGSGSVGVKLCRSADELQEHAAALLKQRHNERGMPIPHGILLEEPVAGPEFSVESFDDQIVGITEKHLGAPPYFVETGHDFPALLSGTVEESVSRSTLDALRALGLGWGPAHTELRLTVRGPTIIEVNPRLAGGFIPELVRKAQAIDLIAETIRRVAGQRPTIRKFDHRHASIRFILPDRDGVLVTVEGLDRIREIPGVDEARLYIKPGESLLRRGDFRDRIGHVITTGDSPEAARDAVRRASGLLRVRIEPETIAAAGG
jgi:biotin carboxylase